MNRVLQVICRRKRQDLQIRGYRTAEYERNAKSFSLSVFFAYALRIALIFCCSVAMDLQVLSFSFTNNLQDPVRHYTK